LLTNSEILSISPLTGKYFEDLIDLSYYFSEYATIKYKLMVACDYLIYICNLDETPCRPFNIGEINEIKQLYIKYDMSSAKFIIDLAKKYGDQIYAINEYIKKHIDSNISYIHYGLSSEDVSSLSMAIMINDFKPTISKYTDDIINQFDVFIDKYDETVFIPRSQGQPCTPTTISQIFRVYKDRICRCLKEYKQSTVYVKFGGTTGNLNAHYMSLPNADWHKLMDEFVYKYDLPREKFTTQVGSNDGLVSFIDSINKINGVLVDLSMDMWSYGLMGYIIKKGSTIIGDSSMPHKTDLSEFDLAEGNLNMSSYIINSMKIRLTKSRLYGDLSNSVLYDNIGVPLGYFIVGIRKILKGMKKISFNKEFILEELSKYSIVLMEGIQTIMKREGVVNAYEICKNWSNAKNNMTPDDIMKFCDNLHKYGISSGVIEEIKNNIDISNYQGLSYYS